MINDSWIVTELDSSYNLLKSISIKKVGRSITGYCRKVW